MTYKIYSEKKLLKMDDQRTNISVSLNGTRETLEFIEHIIPFIKTKFPLRFNIQKARTGSADVLIETELDSQSHYGTNILIKNGFGFNYSGEGSRGLVEMLKKFDIPESETEQLISQHNDSLENKRLIIEI